MNAKIEAELRTKLKEKVKNTVDTKFSSISRPHVFDSKLEASLNRAFDKLEIYYPEHKVFSLDSIDSELRERMSKLYKKAGYISMDDMLHAYGFEIISGSKVKELRSSVLYTPGNEPDFIKHKVDNMLVLLAEYYPDYIISRGMQNDHKSLAGKISGLYQWFGYDTQRDFLAAYGYEYNAGESGRPAQDYQSIIDMLVAKYQNGPKLSSMRALLVDNPDLKGPLKTLQNKSNELFGMSLTKYFEQLGILVSVTSNGPSIARVNSTKSMERITETATSNDTGTTRVNRAALARIQRAALATLTALYEQLDVDTYGTVDKMIESLEGMNVRQNKAGQVYIFRAIDCGKSITIPYGINFLSSGAFSGQRELEKITINASLTEIPAEAFSDCPALSSITLPEGVIAIGEKAFMNCTSLQSITIPESVQLIANNVFVGCTALKEVKILNPRILIGDDVFDGCLFEYEPHAKTDDATPAKFFKYSTDRKGNITITGFTGDMESVVIPGMIEGHLVTTIGKGAFRGNQRIVDVSMSDCITTMEGDAFRGCISLKRIHLSNGISKIITTAFKNCVVLQEVNIPDAVTEIKHFTFKDSPITRMHIGKSLVSIESKLFFDGVYGECIVYSSPMRAINKITVDAENPYLKASGAAILSKNGKILMAFLDNVRTYAIPEGVEHIADYAFAGLKSLSDVILPDTVISIGENAFLNTAIRSVVFGKNVKVIKNAAFASCEKLTAAKFNDGLEEIGEAAFKHCPIMSVVLPASLKLLGKDSFSCSSVYHSSEQKREFKIDESNPCLKTDGKALYHIAADGMTLQSFYGEVAEYEIAAGTLHIAPDAFSRCFSLGKITIPDGVLSIGEDAFIDCCKLKEVNLPNSIETIGAKAFKGTIAKSFKLGAAVKHIGIDAFSIGSEWENKCTRLRDIEVDKANTTYYVDRNALLKRKNDGTSAIVVYFGEDKTLVLPDGVSEIYPRAFMRSVFQEIQIPSSVTIIGEHAFSGCRQLIRLRVGFAEPENENSFIDIYIPENTNGNKYLYLDCIRVDGNGKVFDFVKYDSLFETITEVKEKILVATLRLGSAIQLSPLYRDKYIKYLRRYAKKAIEIAIEHDDLPGLNTLAELELFTSKNIDAVIEFANQTKKTEILSYLMNYKNTKIGISEKSYEL